MDTQTDTLPANLTLQTSPLDLSLVVPPISTAQAVAMIDAKPLAAATPRGQGRHRRKGRVASLPKMQRDMVNRMLWNGVPYRNIVAALDHAGFALIERNISNWATGGYLEWRLEQEAVLENRLNQDHLLDFLRRDDAPELPEVGLQAAATRLSQVLLQKLARADDPEANLESFSKLVDLACPLNREIATTQKNRDDSRRSLGPEHNPDRVKDVEQLDAIENERYFSDPDPQSTLAQPATPALLPPVPTPVVLAQQAREERHEAELAREKERLAFLKRVLQPNSTPAESPKQLPQSTDNAASPAANPSTK